MAAFASKKQLKSLGSLVESRNKMEGLPELLRNIETLKARAMRSVMAAGLRKEGQEAAKIIKQETPSRYKDARKLIGWRMAKAKGQSKDTQLAKAGTGVGFRKGTKKRSKALQKGDRSGKKGVGIGLRNLHWFFVGTGSRVDKQGRETGKMPAVLTSVSSIASRNRTRLMGAFYTGAKAKFDKEVAKLKVPA